MSPARPTHLSYVLDTGGHTARWVSADEHPSPWVRRYVDTRGRPPLPYRLGRATQWVGTAPVLDVPPPRIRVLDHGAGTVRMHVSSARNAGAVVLVFDRSTTHVTAQVPGRPPLGLATTRVTQVSFADLPASGVTLTLRGDPTEVTAFDRTEGLGRIPGYVPRPADEQRTGIQDSDQVYVGRTYRL